MDGGCQLDLTFGPGTAGRTQLTRRHIAYPYHAAAPVSDAAGVACLVLQSVSGGLYGGERLTQRIGVEAGARAALVQPAATVVRRMAEGQEARQAIHLAVARGASFAYLARPLVFLPGAALTQEITVTWAPGARLLLRDGFLAHAPGERGRDWRFTSRLTIRAPDGRLLSAERMAVDRATLEAGRPGAAGGAGAFGKLWLLGTPQTEAEAIGRRIMADWPAEGAVYAAASALPGGCGVGIAIAAADGGALDAALEAMTRLFG
ncbi:urease accessory protein UreD [Acidisoma sp. 7E03]